MSLQQFAKDLSGLYFLKIDDDLIARTKAEIDHRLKFVTMSGVADRFVIEFADLAEECIGQSRCAARGLKSLERRKAVKCERLDLGHRFDLSYLAVTDHASDLDIFVDQALDRKNELVIERRLWILRQAADADMDLVDAIKSGRTVHRQYRDHTRGQAAVGNDVDPGCLCFGVESELLIDDVVIAAEIAEISACFDRGL